MKKTLALLFATVMMIFAVVPVSALESPTTEFEYDIDIPQNPGGGNCEIVYGEQDELGYYNVTLVAKPQPGYEFDYWEIISGDVKLKGSINDIQLLLGVKSDIQVRPVFKKIGATEPTQGSTDSTEKPSVDVDNSSTSPQTGSNNIAVYAFGAYAVLACAFGVAKLVKKSNTKSK